MTSIGTEETRRGARRESSVSVISNRQYFVDFLHYVEKLLPTVGVREEHGPAVVKFLASRFGKDVLQAKTEADLNNIRHHDACAMLQLIKSRKVTMPPQPVFPDRIAFEAFLRKLGDQASCWGLKPAGIDRIRQALEEHLAQGLPADSYTGRVFPDRVSLEHFMDKIDDIAQHYSAGPEGACRIYQVVRTAIQKNFGRDLPERESDLTLFPNKFAWDMFISRVADIAPDFGVAPANVRTICQTLTELFGASFAAGTTPRRRVRQRQGVQHVPVFQNQDRLDGFLQEVERIARAVDARPTSVARLCQVLKERLGQG